MGCLIKSIAIDLISTQSHECFHPREVLLIPSSINHFQAPLAPHPLDRLLDYQPPLRTYFLLLHPRHATGLHNLIPYPIEG